MTAQPPDDRKKSAVLLLLLALLSSAHAEPVVDRSELPRIPPTTPGEALDTFQISPGYRLELVAAEPLVADLIAMAFDGMHRLFVVEMRGYSERRDEKLGRVRLLVDENNDGRFDSSTVYAEGLAWPTAVIAWKRGIFVAATPDILYFEDGDGDGIAESSRRVFTGFGAGTDRLNVQALVNSFKWGPDGRIHGATAGNGGRVRRAEPGTQATTQLRGVDFSFDPEKLDLRAENGGGQYGLCFDRAGRKFVCSNSNHIQQILYPRRYAGQPLPPARLGISADGPAAEVYRLSEDEPWRIVRTRWRVAGKVKGPIEGGGRVSGYFTAATGLCIHEGDAFICDAGSNLVHRKSLVSVDGSVPLLARRPEGELDREFLASSDNWFRPVQAVSGPDGALYIADMYREVIEHPWSLPDSIKRHLDLNSGNDRGRIYRIVPDGFEQPAPVDYDALSSAELITRLGHPDRDLALRALNQRRPPDCVAELRNFLNRNEDDIAGASALGLLTTLGGPGEAQLLRALAAPNPALRRRAITLSESYERLPESIRSKLAGMASDPKAEVRFQLALTLGLRTGDWRIPVLAEILASPGDGWLRAAALKALGNSAGTAFATLAASEPPPPVEQLVALAAMVGESGSEAEAAQVLEDANRKVGQRFQILAALARKRSESTWPSDLADSASSAASDTGAPLAERVAAIRIHTILFPDEPENLRRLLATSEEPAILDAIARSLQHWDNAESAEPLIDRWAQFSPGGRVHAINAMLRTARVPTLLASIRDGNIPRHMIDGPSIERLVEHSSPSVRALAAKVFEERLTTAQRVARYSTALDLTGDRESGRTIFARRCSVCHRAKDGTGFAYGPDVSSFSSAGKDPILSNIIAPNREVAPQFAAYELELKDGRKLAGRIKDQDDQQVRLAFPAGVELAISRDEVISLTRLNHSPMPERLETDLSQQEMADLLAFLTSEK